jgi:multifunctional 2-oxoglutarate metabolism enzyme
MKKTIRPTTITAAIIPPTKSQLSDGAGAGAGAGVGAGVGIDPAGVRRVVLCSGKIYYDLADRRRQNGATDVALVRVERLYPRPTQEIAAELAKFPASAEVVWVQEEPANMGSWPYMALHLPIELNRRISVVSRPASSAPASGKAKVHAAEQAAILDAVFATNG